MLVVALTCAAIYHVVLTVSTALSSSLVYPFMDQFRINLRYLTAPFPESILALENGHRLILPGLLRVLELERFAGWPVLQTATTWCGAAAAGLLLLWRVHRDLGLASVLGATAVCAVGTLLYSNTNARIFIDAFDGVHIFWVAFFVVAAAVLTAGRSAAFGAAPWLAALVLCVGATFTFGPGIASFATVGVIAILRRRFGMAAMVAVTAVLVLVLYEFVLPGGTSVRRGVATASPMLTPLYAAARMGAVAAEAVRTLELGAQARLAIGVATGALVATAVGASLVARWRQTPSFSQTELVGIGVFVFGSAANVLIAIGRTQYFVEHPNELFADRYVIWGCLAWLGAILYGVGALRTGSLASKRVTRMRASAPYVLAGIVLALSVAMVRSAVEINEWAGNVYRMSAMQAVAWRLQLPLDDRLAELTDGDVPGAYRLIEEMRMRHLNLFEGSGSMAIGQRVPVSGAARSVPVRTSVVPTSDAERPVATLVSGVLPLDMNTPERHADLWLASSDGRLVGRAAFTAPGDEAPALGRLGRSTLRAFDGYVPARQSGDLYLLWRTDAGVSTLARLVPQPSATAP